MQDMLYQTILEILQTLMAVTAELHARHVQGTPEAAGKACREESCVALGRLEAQVEALRRSLGLASFRSRGV